MRFKRKKKNELPTTLESLTILWDHLFVVVSIAMIIGPSIIGYVLDDITGLIIGVIATFITINFWSGLFRKKHNLSFRRLCQAISILRRNKRLLFISAIILNLTYFFGYSVNIKLPTDTIIAIALSITTVTFVSAKINKSFKYRFVLRLVLLSCFNFVVLLNSVITVDQYVESYHFSKNSEYVPRSSNYDSGGYQNTTLITLSNYALEEYYWYRFFMTYEDIKGQNKVNYHFKKGLLGLSYLSSYELEYEYIPRTSR